MLKVRLMGGLGNQLFQYAFARAFEVKNSQSVCLDLTFLNDKTERANLTLRNFELGVFPISLKTVSADPRTINNILFKFFNKIHQLLIPQHFVLESGQIFRPEYLEKRSAKLAIGYFQSEKYFLGIREDLLRELDFTDTVSEANHMLARKISSQNSVSLHVRRGDYVSLVANQDIIGACNLNYYSKSIKYIEKNTANPIFYVFSDDIQWAKSNLIFNSKVEFIDHNKGTDSFQDMFLMSQCKHNIIANSSFSWWGAWLNKNENKIVTAPENWYLSKKMNAKDLYCKGFIKL